jgi:hypothetical protein
LEGSSLDELLKVCGVFLSERALDVLGLVSEIYEHATSTK